MEEGWIKLWRKTMESEVFQNPELLKVWLWCLLKANHKAQYVPVETGRGTTQVWVERGQFVFGRYKAAKALKMKPPTVQGRMQKLANMQNLTIKSVTHYSIVTICNYEPYQRRDNDDPSPNPSTIHQPSITNKNDKNEKKESETESELERAIIELLKFWSQAFKKWFKKPYHHTGVNREAEYAKEAELMDRLLATHDLKELKGMAIEFFKREDPGLSENDFTIEAFCSWIADQVQGESKST